VNGETLSDRLHAQRVAEITARQRYWEAQFAATEPGNNQRNFFSHEIEMCMKKVQKLEKQFKEDQEKCQTTKYQPRRQRRP
jgi:hypothetical protein